MKDYAKIAVCHPGKIGDALYCLPTIQALAAIHGPVDFYTSSHCAPLRRLLEFQSCVKNFIIPESYVIQSMDCGVQPWEMPVPAEAGYEKVFQLGFKGCPSGPLPDYIARTAGIDIPPVTELKIECPDPDLDDELWEETLPKTAYIVLASRHPTSYDEVFQEFIKICPLPIVQVGADCQFLPSQSRNGCGMDMLEMASLIKTARGFVGMMSAPLVVANAFPVPKVAPHDGIHWDMSHVIRSPLNHYPVLPTAKQICELLGL